MEIVKELNNFDDRPAMETIKSKIYTEGDMDVRREVKICSSCGHRMEIGVADSWLKHWNAVYLLDSEGHYWFCPACAKKA